MIVLKVLVRFLIKFVDSLTAAIALMWALISALSIRKPEAPGTPSLGLVVFVSVCDPACSSGVAIYAESSDDRVRS